MSSIEITNYYAALNEMASMYADRIINDADFINQRRMMYWLWHEVDV